MTPQITGKTASDIAASIRGLADQGFIQQGEVLPPVRLLAQRLRVNRNTVASAYRQLVQAGVAVTRGRGGTSIVRPSTVPEEGFTRGTHLRDIGSGNPSAALLPDVSTALSSISTTPVLYGQSVIDPQLEAWAQGWISADHPGDFGLQVTSGSVEAVESLLAQALTQGDAVALEDPCFLTSVHTVLMAGYRPVPVPVDEAGMTVEGLRSALDAGVRAVVCTPRAHNPTGASLTAERAAALREVLADFPYVLVIEDDHFSLLSTSPYRSVIGTGHERWALVRSVSKFLGPDLGVALVAADRETAERLGSRISPGTVWVSHLLQRLVFRLLTDEAAQGQIRRARTYYAERNRDFVGALASRGIFAKAEDGLNVWVDVKEDAGRVAARLERLGWLARTGEEFALTPGSGASRHLRLTVHDLSAALAEQLTDDLVAAMSDRA